MVNWYQKFWNYWTNKYKSEVFQLLSILYIYTCVYIVQNLTEKLAFLILKITKLVWECISLVVSLFNLPVSLLKTACISLDYAIHNS